KCFRLFFYKIKDGIEEIIEINLTNNEKEKFNNSCNIIRSYIEKSKEI
ncbi:L-lactate dehydrogenase 2, partial [human gut metagenome]